MLYSIFRADRLDEAAKDRFREMFSYTNVDLSPMDSLPDLSRRSSMSSWKTMLTNILVRDRDDLIREGVSYGRAMTAWWLKWMRIYHLQRLIDTISNMLDSAIDIDLNPQAENVAGVQFLETLRSRFETIEMKYIKDIALKIQNPSQKEALLKGPDLAFALAEQLRNRGQLIKHFYDMAEFIPEVNRYSPEGKLPPLVVTEIRKIVDEYKNEHAQMISPEDHASAVPIIKFPDGSAWFDLERGGCPIEARAMGHCGNGAGQSWQTVLSYRVPVQRGTKVFWKPHLTFILDTRNKSLGEMKGRNNDKPVAKYHPQIIALLKSDYVERIRGGGYLPENNFSIDDLTPEQQHELLTKKPTLAPPGHALKMYVNNPKQVPKEVLSDIREMLIDAGLTLRDTSLPRWEEKNKGWAIYTDPSEESLIEDLFPGERRRGSSLALSIVNNNMFDEWDNGGIGKEYIEEAWDHLSDDLKRRVKEFIKSELNEEFQEYATMEMEKDEGEEEVDPTGVEDDAIFDFIKNERGNLFDALVYIADDALRYGAESEAHEALTSLLKDASRDTRYNVEIVLWDGPPRIIVDTMTFSLLLNDLDSLADEGLTTWLKLYPDVTEPHYGFSGVNWETAMDMADDRFSEVGVN